MKKGWKVFSVVCAVIAGTGIVLCLISFAMGGRYSDLGLSYHRVWGPFGYFNGHNGSTYDSYEVRATDSRDEFENIKSLDISTTSCEVRIGESDSDKVTIETENVPKELGLKYYREGDGTFVVETKENVVTDGDDARIYIDLPKDRKFSEADLFMGAGRLYADGIHADDLDLEVGAGYAEVSGFKANEVSASCGAGELVLSGETLGDVDIECGVGKIELTTPGREEDYDYSLECGVGEVKYGNRNFSGIAREIDADNGAGKSMDISCSMGAVIVNFEGQ